MRASPMKLNMSVDMDLLGKASRADELVREDIDGSYASMFEDHIHILKSDTSLRIE